MNIKRAFLTAAAVLMVPGFALAQTTVTFDTQVKYPAVIPDGTVLKATLTCNTGSPLSQSSDISEDVPVIFVVEEFENFADVLCTISLGSSPNGYDLFATANTHVLNGTSCVYTNADDLDDSVEVEVEGANTCLFTWSQEKFTYSVSKVWDYDSADAPFLEEEAKADWTCENVCDVDPTDGECSPGTETGTFDLDGDDTDSVSFWANPAGGSACFATEEVADSAVESDQGCEGKVAFPVGTTAGGCTITNTVFFEGIPTLSQYGLAIMALLMLGVGYVGFRRFV